MVENVETSAAYTGYITYATSLKQAASFMLKHGIEDIQVVHNDKKASGNLNQSLLLNAMVNGLSPETPVCEIIALHSILEHIGNCCNNNVYSFKYAITENKLNNKFNYPHNEWKTCSDSIHNPMLVTNKEGRIIIFTKALEQLSGISFDKALGCKVKELFKDKVHIISSGGKNQSMIKHNQKTLLSNCTPIFGNDQMVIGAIAILQDISDTEKMPTGMQTTKRLYQQLDSIFESSYDGIYVTDGKGNTLRLNQAFERIMGINSKECLGRNIAKLVRDGVFSESGTLIALTKREPVTIPIQSRTGKNALVTSTPVTDANGNVVLVVTNVRDITELKQVEEKIKDTKNKSYVKQNQLIRLNGSHPCVYQSKEMHKLMNLVNHVAGVDSTVLIQGESGVGKEVIADILHNNSNRKNSSFIKVNCGAIPHNLMESELFGYDAGAFSGASKKGKAGMFELADGGTLFLDEISEMPLDLQVKLLRVLQEKQIMRVGGTKAVNINVRILAGTNRDLEQMVDENKFRKDLFYRLNVVPIIVPPLRQRRKDIPALIAYFLELYNKKHNMHKKLSNEVIQQFVIYDWPGNVRELENLIERLVVTTRHDIIGAGDISNWSQVKCKIKPEPDIEIVPLNTALEETERKLLQKAFSMYDSTYAVARVLGVSQSTVVRKSAKYKISEYR